MGVFAKTRFQKKSKIEIFLCCCSSRNKRSVLNKCVVLGFFPKINSCGATFIRDLRVGKIDSRFFRPERRVTSAGNAGYSLHSYFSRLFFLHGHVGVVGVV